MFLAAVLDRRLVFVAGTDVACIVALKKVEHGRHVFVLLLHNSFFGKRCLFVEKSVLFWLVTAEIDVIAKCSQVHIQYSPGFKLKSIILACQ